MQVGVASEKPGRSACSELLIADAQSVKNTDTAGPKRYDAGKKVSGINRHIAVEILMAGTHTLRKSESAAWPIHLFFCAHGKPCRSFYSISTV